MKATFGIVYADVMKDPDLSLQAKGLYGLLSTFVRGKEDRTCFASVPLLAEYAGVDRRTIYRALKELKAKGYAKKEGKIITIT